MEYRNPKPSSSQLSHFDRAFSRAMTRVGIKPETDPEPDHEPGASGEDALSLAEDSDEESAEAEPLLVNGAQLLSAVREPVEWLLDLARRLASDDPVDAAAVARVHKAFCARLRGQPAHLRPSDLFIVLGLLLSALDPRVAARAVADTVGDRIAAVLGTESPEGDATETAVPPAQQQPRRSRLLSWYRPRNTHQDS